MSHRSGRPRAVVLLTAAALLWGPAAGPASAAPPPVAVAGATAAGGAELVATVEDERLAPGGTTTVHALLDDGSGDLVHVTGAVFRASRQDVVRVFRDGTVHVLRPGTATVRVRLGRLETSVTIHVGPPRLVNQSPYSPDWCSCRIGLLGGGSFTPGAEVRLTTDGTPGVLVSDDVAFADGEGVVRAEIHPWDGGVLSGLVWWIALPSSPEGPTCAEGTSFTITATDTAGVTAVHHDTC